MIQFDVATITWPVWLLVLALILALGLGALLGYLNSNLDARKKLEEARARADIIAQQARGDAERAAARIAHAEQMALSRAPASLPGTSLLRLWLDEDNAPQLDLDGQRLKSVHLSDADRKRLIHLLNIVRPWVEGKPAAAGGTPMMEALSPAARPPAPAPSAPIPAAEAKAAEPTSIVGQIDRILQARLAASPLGGRDIRLEEGYGGVVNVWVGRQKFTGVGEVTDPEVRAVIQAAITEWEKKYTPGM